MSHEIDQVSKTSISLRFIAVFHVKNDRLDAADFIFFFDFIHVVLRHLLGPICICMPRCYATELGYNTSIKDFLNNFSLQLTLKQQ